MKELWEYKLDILYYGIRIGDACYKKLKKDSEGKITHENYITTNGLFIVLDDSVYVNARIDEKSPYIVDEEDNKTTLKYNNQYICYVVIKQSPEFYMNSYSISSGRKITDLVNIHGDRIRIQPIRGCANGCTFCDLNKMKYELMPLKELDEACNYVMNNTSFKHILISGGTPRNIQMDYDYLNDVYKYFGEKYGKEYSIDVMLVPRGLTTDQEDYVGFLKKLKEWNISGIYANIELYNDLERRKHIPQKEDIGKAKYMEFLKKAVKVFGKGNVKSCIIVGLEDIKDSLKAVDELSNIGCIPILSPFIPNDNNSSYPTPEFMKEILIKANDIVKNNNIELGPICDMCKHNTIHFK